MALYFFSSSPSSQAQTGLFFLMRLLFCVQVICPFGACLDALRADLPSFCTRSESFSEGLTAEHLGSLLPAILLPSRIDCPVRPREDESSLPYVVAEFSMNPFPLKDKEGPLSS